MQRKSLIALALLALVALLTWAGCGETETTSKDGGETTTASSDGATTVEDTGSDQCGELVASPPDDPDGVLEGLPPEITEGYEEYKSLLVKSVYQDFKPKNDGPWTIGYSDSFSGNAWRAAALERLEENVELFKEAGIVKDLIVTDSNLDNSRQIQQMRSMIQQGVDVILSIPNSPTAMNGVIKEAYEAGIPVLTLLSPVTSKYAVNIDVNQFLIGARMAQGLAQILDDNGEIIMVEGLPGTPGNELISSGADAIFDKCPDIEVVGRYNGNWDNATAKTNTLKFLATHPGEIDGVWEQGSMGLGIMQALEQAGRPLVTVTDGNPDKASLAVWRDNIDNGYEGVATANVPGSEMDAMFRVAIRMLQGQGLKLNAIVKNPPLIMGDDLFDWVEDDWTEETPGVADAPPATWQNDDFLDLLFENPAPTEPATRGSCPCERIE